MPVPPAVLCVLCGHLLSRPGRPEDALCPVCRALVFPGITLAPAGRCEVCRQELLGEQNRCIDCAAQTWSFTRIHGLFPYHGPCGELVRAYKGHAKVTLAKHWVSQLLPHIDAPGILVPVPGHRRHLRERGWDPVKLVTETLARETGFSIVNALNRRATASQKQLGRAQRALNALESYATGRRISQVRGCLVWLIDDVVTTGWTAESCARLLVQAGAFEVRVLCLCLH